MNNNTPTPKKQTTNEGESYLNKLDELKNAIIDGRKIIKGLKETLRAIETNKAEKVYLARDCEIRNYLTLIKEYCVLFNIELIEIPNWTSLRDVVMINNKNFKPTDKIKNKLKISPRCYCAAILC